MKKFQKYFKVHFRLSKPEKISRFQSANAWLWNARKFWKYSKSKQEVNIQNGWFWKKTSKLKLKYGWIKFRNQKINLKFRLAEIFSNFPWKYNWTNYRSQLDIYTTKIWEENLNSNQIQCANVQIFKLKLRFNVQMYRCLNSHSNTIKFYMQAHVKISIQDGWSSLWHMKTIDHVMWQEVWFEVSMKG